MKAWFLLAGLLILAQAEQEEPKFGIFGNWGNWGNWGNKPSGKPLDISINFGNNKPNKPDKIDGANKDKPDKQDNWSWSWNWSGPGGSGTDSWTGIDWNSVICQSPSLLSWFDVECEDFSDLPSIVENAVETEELSTLVSVLTAEDYKPILDALSGEGPFTVFAPSNDAFAAAGIDVSDVDTVTEVLKYHVVSGRYLAMNIGPWRGNEITTLQGEAVHVKKDRGNKVKVNNENVVKADIKASNGVIHIIDGVLIPNALRPSIPAVASGIEELSTLVAVLTSEAYSPVLEALSAEGPFTVFAPTNEAFDASGIDANDVERVTEILKYHVVAGRYTTKEFNHRLMDKKLETLQGEKIRVHSHFMSEKISVNKYAVLSSDNLASNGIIHIIDGVLVPQKARESLVQTVVSTPSLSTLTSVLTSEAYAPVLEALSGEGPFTVFAPSNEAFAAAGVDVSNVEAVTDVLKYHVVAGFYPSKKLRRRTELETLQGRSVVTHKFFKMFKVDDANVVERDIIASNGVVHVIDKVLDSGACQLRGALVRHGFWSNIFSGINNNSTKCICKNGQWDCTVDLDAALGNLGNLGDVDVEVTINGEPVNPTQSDVPTPKPVESNPPTPNPTREVLSSEKRDEP